jgi:replicative DNA helicase
VDHEIPVLYISTEQTQRDEISRLLSLVSQVPEKSLANGMFAEMENDWDERVVDAIQRVRQAPIYFAHDPFFTLSKLLRVIKKHSIINGVKAVFFDYIKIPTENIASRDKWAAVGDLAYGLKACASDQNLPVITAVQINRDGADSFKFTGEIDSDAFANSDMIAQAMSVGMVLRPLNKEENKEHNWVGEKRILRVTDNRHGPSNYKGLYTFKDDVITLEESSRID